MRNGEKMIDRLMGGLELIDEPIPLRPLIEIIDNKRVLIENHRGVTQYSSEQICVKLAKGSVTVCGEGLRLAVMQKEQLVICGCVNSVHMCGGSRR